MNKITRYIYKKIQCDFPLETQNAELVEGVIPEEDDISDNDSQLEEEQNERKRMYRPRKKVHGKITKENKYAKTKPKQTKISAEIKEL